MAGVRDQVENVALLYAGPGRVVVPPPASGTLQGSGVWATERATCEPLDPSQFLSIDDDPDLPLWERLVSVSQRLWDDLDQNTAIDVAGVGVQYLNTITSVYTDNPAGTREQYLTAVGQSYSDYVRDYFVGYLDLLIGAWNYCQKVVGCEATILQFSAESLMALLAGQRLDFDAMATSLTADCGVLLQMIQAWASIEAWYQTLMDDPLLVVGAALELVAEYTVATLEKLADAQIIEFLRRYATDHVAIGQLHGTLIGVVIAEIVIDELITLGAGKVVRGVRWIRVVP